MHKNILTVIGITILFLGTYITPSVAIDNQIKPISNGNTLYVGGTGEGNYSSIQDAIDNASIGDTVFVYDDSSPYYENVVVDKSINLIGEDKNTTIIDADGIGSVVRLAVNYITVSGFTIQNSGNKPETNSGIEAGRFGSQADYSIIKDNKIVNNWDGIHSVFSNECHYINNIIMNNRNHGIYLRACDENCNISYNIIKNNKENGMVIHEKGHFVFRNIIENNSIGILFSDCEVTENIFNNNNYGIITGDFGKIYSNKVTNNSIGIFIYGGIHNEIKHNNLLKNSRHVSFDLLFLFRFILPLFIYPFQLNKWRSNYYEGHRFGPKIIRGKMIFDIESEISIPWINIDWFPAKEPYNIDWLKEC